MKSLIQTLVCVLICLTLASCAAGYRPINPPNIRYTASNENQGVLFSYRYGVLQERNNRRYAKKEDQNGIRLLAVKISNQHSEALMLGQNLMLYSGEKQLNLIERSSLQRIFRQNVATYLPYALLTFLTLNIETSNTIESYRIGYVIGPVVTIGNMAVAGGANANLRKELEQYDLSNRSIAPGETVYGIVGIYSPGYDPINIRVQGIP